jgi:hypothetical protein
VFIFCSKSNFSDPGAAYHAEILAAGRALSGAKCGISKVKMRHILFSGKLRFDALRPRRMGR